VGWAGKAKGQKQKAMSKAFWANVRKRCGILGEIILCFYAKAFNINFQLKHATVLVFVDVVVVVVVVATA